MSDSTVTGEAPKREEQVLVLAARGLTDKEIAIKLGISPDTVGTYWRRILAKYQASSRTEVVAKYASERSKAAVENLQYVNECLKLVADHMIEQAGKSAPVAAKVEASIGDAILSVASDWIVLLSLEGEVLFSNKPVPSGSKMSDLIDSADLDEALSLGASMEADAELSVSAKAPKSLSGSYSFRFTPGEGELNDTIVGIGRSY